MERLARWWNETTTWWTGQKAEWYAAYGTIIYIGIIIMVVGAKLEELFTLSLNELGDFLAGSFGPMAFLWLVLGYRQQGRELRLSSDALRLQAEELRNSVEQQTQLVMVGKEQIAAQIEAQNRERHRYETSMNANIVFSPGVSYTSAGEVKHEVQLTNLGGDATGLDILTNLPGFRGRFSRITALRRNQPVTITLSYKSVREDHHSTMTCFYRTLDGRNMQFDMDCFIRANTTHLSIAHPVNIEDL